MVDEGKQWNDVIRKGIPLGKFIWEEGVKHWRLKSKITRRPLPSQQGFWNLNLNRTVGVESREQI